MPWFYNQKTGATLHAPEETVLFDILVRDANCSQIEKSEQLTDDMATEATEDTTEEAEDLSGLSKEELVHMAQLMGISVRSKDSIAKIREKIEAEREAN